MNKFINFKTYELGEIFELKQGNHLPVAKLEKEGYPVFGANGQIGFYSDYMHEESIIVVTCRGATCGSINLTKPKSWVTGNAIALLSKLNTDLKYFYYYLRSLSFKDVISGSAQPQIIVSNLIHKKIRIPSLHFQRKIASILDKCASAAAKRKQANHLTDEFLKSVFLEMFGDPVRNPKGWKVNSIETIIESVKNENPSKYRDKRYDYIDISSIDNTAKEVVSIKKITGAIAPSRARQLVTAGDVLVSTVRPNLNAVALVPDTATNPIASTGFCVLRINKKRAHERYLFEISKMQFFIDSLTKIAKGASYPAVTDNDIKIMEIPVPPLFQQQKFADIVQKVEKLKEKQRNSEKELDNLFNSLMQRAFKGELVQ